MDRTVYYNAESCSTFSDDSYQRSPIISRGSTPRRSPIMHTSSNTPDKKKELGRAISEKLVNQNKQRRTGHNNNNNTKDNFQRQVIVGQVVKNNASSRASKQQQQQHFQQDRPLTKKVIHAGISRIAIPNQRDREDVELHYGSVLVLHLQCKNITTMTPSSLDPFYNLKNLYLYKNSIRRIQGLDGLTNLELLDLSRNNVERIDNLDKCKRLKKLYLGFNEVQVVEGIENLCELEEFLLDDQDIPPEQPLIFIPGIMDAVVNSLVQLDVSSNQLPSIRPLVGLQRLQTLNASNNLLDDFEDTLSVLETLHQLQILDLKGNPIASKPVYRSKVIGAVYKLERLDGKDIPDTTRSCVQKLRFIKESRIRLREEAELLRQLKSETSQKEQPNPMANCPYKLDPNFDFNFSTPTRCSPVPKALSFPPSAKPVMKEQQPSLNFLDQSSYESRARALCTEPTTIATSNNSNDQQMSDMAKIIFRLSNLDNNDKDDGSGDASGTNNNNNTLNYWEFPGSSMTPECRALSPIENFEYLSASTSSSSTITEEKKLNRPKPAGPGGRSSTINSNNNVMLDRYVYGRTLSPLIELPTPESSTARDEA